MKYKPINIRKVYGIYVLIQPKVDFKFVNMIRADFEYDLLGYEYYKNEFANLDAPYYNMQILINIYENKIYLERSEFLDSNKKNFIYRLEKSKIAIYDENKFDTDFSTKKKLTNIDTNTIIINVVTPWHLNLLDICSYGKLLNSLYDDFVIQKFINYTACAFDNHKDNKKSNILFKKCFERYIRICENPTSQTLIPSDNTQNKYLRAIKWILAFPKIYNNAYIENNSNVLTGLEDILHQQMDMDNYDIDDLNDMLYNNIKMIKKMKINLSFCNTQFIYI